MPRPGERCRYLAERRVCQGRLRMQEMKPVLAKLLRFRLRTLLIVVTVCCVYVGGYLSLRDPFVGHRLETLESPHPSLLRQQIIPEYKSDYLARGEKLPTLPTKFFDPGVRCNGTVAGWVYAPAVWVERKFNQFQIRNPRRLTTITIEH